MRMRWLVAAAAVLGLLAVGAEAACPKGGKTKSREEKVTIDQVPAAVKATILKEAAGAKILEIEKETTGKKVVYEAEFVVKGKTIEIEVAPCGKLLSREVDDDDDDDKEDDDGEEDDDDDEKKA